MSLRGHVPDSQPLTRNSPVPRKAVPKGLYLVPLLASPSGPEHCIPSLCRHFHSPLREARGSGKTRETLERSTCQLVSVTCQLVSCRSEVQLYVSPKETHPELIPPHL